MKLKEVKEKYKDEWVLAEVLKEDESGEPTEVNVIAHSKNRDDTYDAMKKVKGKYSFHFYTGKIPQKGYAVEFNEKIRFEVFIDRHNKSPCGRFLKSPVYNLSYILYLSN